MLLNIRCFIKSQSIHGQNVHNVFKRWKPEQDYLTKTLENTKGAIKKGQSR